MRFLIGSLAEGGLRIVLTGTEGSARTGRTFAVCDCRRG